mmetsp:Transcript_93239/g.179140  ORF Transcript_93239/g.179140 Transcript_93239/m.179140 type:complete len:127 (+) Transcript_93239:338-718(+)
MLSNCCTHHLLELGKRCLTELQSLSNAEDPSQLQQRPLQTGSAGASSLDIPPPEQVLGRRLEKLGPPQAGLLWNEGHGDGAPQKDCGHGQGQGAKRHQGRPAARAGPVTNQTRNDGVSFPSRDKKG